MSEERREGDAVIAALKPFYCELRGGRKIAWCRCGRSKRQPFCDGRSHIGTGFEPLFYTPQEELEEVLLCGCKQTATPPFCDGTHNNLPGGYLSDQRSDEERARLRKAKPDDEGVRRVDDRCYAVAPGATRPQGEPAFWIRKIIAPSFGAQHQSQFYLELREGSSPILAAGATDVILFVAEGAGVVEISGRAFQVAEGDGIYVRPEECFRLVSSNRIVAYVSALPAVESLEQLESVSRNFDARHPQRVSGVDAAQRSEMGPRYFQMLVDKSVGSVTAAQFIGHIPQSRGEMHRHLYEESLIILSGAGMIWNEESYATVGAGDVIFLPRKQAHSLECTDPEGMDVVGIIHPGDNPGINY